MPLATLSYHAHEGCPPAAVFVEQVRARTSNVEFGAGKPTVEVVVEITRAQEQSVGKLVILSLDAARSERELSSATCAELVRALALSAALNLDPTLTDTGESVQPPPASPPKPPTPPPVAVETPRPAETPMPAEPDPERSRATSLGAAFASDVLFGEATAPGVTLFVDHIYAGRTQPSWRAGLHGSRAVVSGDRGAIDLYWVTSRLSGSPIRLHLGTADLVPSAIVDAGVLAGHGRPSSAAAPVSTTLPGKNDSTAWLAVGAGARLEIAFSPKWAVEIEADVLFPLLRPEAGFVNPPAMFAAPPVAATLGAGARYVFR